MLKKHCSIIAENPNATCHPAPCDNATHLL